MDKVGAAPTQDVAVHLEMFATTHPLELAQGTTRVVPYRELAPNNITLVYERDIRALTLQFTKQCQKHWGNSQVKTINIVRW